MFFESIIRVFLKRKPAEIRRLYYYFELVFVSLLKIGFSILRKQVEQDKVRDVEQDEEEIANLWTDVSKITASDDRRDEKRIHRSVLDAFIDESVFL